jgi:hypothetical protein
LNCVAPFFAKSPYLGRKLKRSSLPLQVKRFSSDQATALLMAVYFNFYERVDEHLQHPECDLQAVNAQVLQ